MASPEIHRLLAKAFNQGESEKFPLILEMMVGPEAAELLLALPATAEELAGKFAKPQDALQPILDKGFELGLLLKRPGEGNVVRYHLCAEIVESILVDSRNDQLGDHFFDLWREEYREFVERLGPVEVPRPPGRVLPVEGVVGTAQTILPYESLRTILEKAERRVVLDCVCRKRAQNCENPIRNMCFWLDDAANYFLERGTGREITVDRGMEVFWQAERLGLVHLTDILLYENTPSKVGWICNCCPCCCAIIKTAKRSKGTRDLMRSFRAEVNSHLCDRCGLCGGFCYFGAFRKAEDGLPIINPDHCVGCGLCASQCTRDAIRLIRIEDPALPEETQKQIILAIGE